jgi:hypothetical protein
MLISKRLPLNSVEKFHRENYVCLPVRVSLYPVRRDRSPGFNSVSVEESTMFRRNISSPSSRSKSKPIKQPRRACRLILLVSFLAYSSTLKMEVIFSSETSGSLRTIQHYNPGDHTLHSDSCENLKSTRVCRVGNVVRYEINSAFYSRKLRAYFFLWF